MKKSLLLVSLLGLLSIALPAAGTFTLIIASGDAGDNSGAVVITDPYAGWGPPCSGANFISWRSDGVINAPGQVLDFTRTFEISDGVDPSRGKYSVTFEADDQIQIDVNGISIAGCAEAVCFYADGSTCTRSASGNNRSLLKAGTNTLHVRIIDNPAYGAFIMGSYSLMLELAVGTVNPTKTPPATPNPTPYPTNTPGPSPTVVPTAICGPDVAEDCAGCLMQYSLEIGGIQEDLQLCASAIPGVCATACLAVLFLAPELAPGCPSVCPNVALLTCGGIALVRDIDAFSDLLQCGESNNCTACGF